MSLPGIRLHQANQSSGLRRLAEMRGVGPPYWAYCWAGGLALARHILEHPDEVAGRTVLDLGAGSGLVAVAAARAGAGRVTAAEIDPNGIAAIGLNAHANRVAIAIVAEDLLDQPPPSVEVVLVGDLFYEPELASRVAAFLDRCVSAGANVLVGDPWRNSLPRSRLRLLAEYPVPDFGSGSASLVQGAVFRFVPAPAE